MGEFSEAEMAGLSEEERQAILEGEEEENQAGAANEEDDGAEDTRNEVDTPGTPGETEGDGNAASAPDEEASEEEEAAPPDKSKSEVPPAPFVPTYRADGGQIEGIQTKLAELDQQLEEGDIDIVEYTRKRDPLIRQQTQIEMTQQFNQQQAEQLWKHEQSTFFSQYPDYRSDVVMNGALRSVFKQLDTEENAGKTGYQLLLEAKEIVEARIGGGKVGNSKAEPPPPRPKTPAREAAQLPKTLADSIPAEANATDKDEFAHLDKLEGVEYERALSKLTPDQERRYLGGA